LIGFWYALHNLFIVLEMFKVWNSESTLGVCGSVHHSIIHKENPTRCNSVSTFYFIFIWSSTCFGQHTAHHQEPKIALAAPRFAYVEGCWTCGCWTLSGRVCTLPDSVQQLHVQQPSMNAKPEAASAVLGSWWWTVCRPKHVELHINMKENVDALLHLVGFSLWVKAQFVIWHLWKHFCVTLMLCCVSLSGCHFISLLHLFMSWQEILPPSTHSILYVLSL